MTKKTSLKNFLIALGIAFTHQISTASAIAQSSVATNNAEPDFLAPASASAVAAAAQSQAAGSASQGSQGYTTQTSGANEFHTQVLNPTNQQNNLGLNRTGTATLAPVFGY